MLNTNPKIRPFLNWVFLNLVLPLAPIGIKFFIDIFGPAGMVDFISVWEVSDLLVYSLMINIINLNTNVDGKKEFLEKFARRIFGIFIVLNCLLLALIHLDLQVNHLTIFFLLSIGFPVAAGMYFQYKYQKLEE